MKTSSAATVALRAIIPSALMLLLACPLDALAEPAAQQHLVSPDALHQQMTQSTASRQKNIETLTNFLSTPVAERAMQDAQFDGTQVRHAIPTLSDQELATLASRAADAQQNFAAGRLTRPELAIVVIALVVLVVVIIVH